MIENLRELDPQLVARGAQIAGSGKYAPHNSRRPGRPNETTTLAKHEAQWDGAPLPEEPGSPRNVELADEFWSARPALSHIHRHAQSRAAGPWGALGSVLVRATCAVPPHIKLPPIVGGPMSLNLFAALVGQPGLGKNAADAVGREAVRFVYASLPSSPIELPIGTVEGIARTFRQADAGPDDDSPDTAIFTAPEVDTLAALVARQGSTTEAELRKMYSGEQLGFANAQKHTRTRVAAHSYRAGLIVGVQPLRAGGLFRGADGGTPQRFIWLPVDDPGAPDELPETPEPVTIKIRSLPSSHLVLPEAVRDEILAHRRAMLRREPVDPLDGHRLLSRLKVAAALSVLDSPHREVGEITGEDWLLAGVVMAVSDRTREAVQREVAQRARDANRARALDAAEREEIGDDRRLQRTREAIVRWLAKVPGEEWLARRDLMPKVKANLRGYFDEAVAQLTEEGSIEVRRTDHAHLYRRVQRYSVGTARSTSENNAVLCAVPLYQHPHTGSDSPGKTPRPLADPADRATPPADPEPDTARPAQQTPQPLGGDKQAQDGTGTVKQTPGAPTAATPGYTGRVKDALSKARRSNATGGGSGSPALEAGVTEPYRRMGCNCYRAPRPCYWCELKASNEARRKATGGRGVPR